MKAKALRLHAANDLRIGEFVLTALPGQVGRRYSPEVGLNLFAFSD